MTTRLAAPLTAPPVTQLALFDVSAYVGKRGCLFPNWLAKRLRRKPKRGVLPGLPASQLLLEPCKAALDLLIRLRRVRIGDALVNGRERIEYVALASGGFEQVRWYRSGRIIGVGVVRSDDAPDEIRELLVSVLFARGWSAEACELVEGAAYHRRRTRRALPKWC